jgi:micrococcal nuclease
MNRSPNPWTFDGMRHARRQRRFGGVIMRVTVLTGGGVLGTIAGGLAGAAPSPSMTWLSPAHDALVAQCTVTDGDTLRCGGERIRLIGIDAPELAGHCRRARNCAPGDPVASTKSLQQAIASTMRINRVGQDRYGRTLAMISGPRGDLSCWQLLRGHAIYKAKWDSGLSVARTCPKAIL